MGESRGEARRGADVGAPRRGSSAQIGAERSMFFFEQEQDDGLVEKGLR